MLKVWDSGLNLWYSCTDKSVLPPSSPNDNGKTRHGTKNIVKCPEGVLNWSVNKAIFIFLFCFFLSFLNFLGIATICLSCFRITLQVAFERKSRAFICRWLKCFRSEYLL